MTPSDVMMFAVQVVIFASGMALLSHRFYAVYQRWSGTKFGFKSHLPGLLGTALMLFVILFSSSMGWAYAIATVLAGFAVAYLYVYTLRMRVEAAVLGPVLAMLSMFLTPS